MASTYSSWEYYRDIYFGARDEAAYRRLAIGAAGEINLRTFGRAATAPAAMAGALRDCECELVDILFSMEQSYALLPQGIASVNNDGFSAATGTGAGRADSRAVLHSAEIRAVCHKHLLAPVNLLYTGVRPC